MNKLIAIKNIFVSTFYNLLYKDLNILSDEETIQYILDKNCSISRFGDGEIMIMTHSGSIEFQVYSDELRDKLIEVASNKIPGLLVCIPEIVSKQHKCQLTKLAIDFWNKHLLIYGGLYKKLFANQTILGDTNVSRFYLGIENRDRTPIYINNLKRIWDKRDLLIVEGYNTKLGIGNDLFSNVNNIERIICPNKDCFSSYKQIYDSVVKHYKKGQLVICALGPTASILAYDLQKNHSIQTLDLGHIDIEYMWYLKNADQRIAIEGKNTAEFDTGKEEDFSKRKDVVDKI